CSRILSGERPAASIIEAPPPVFDELELPYDLYTPEDLAHRVLYVEASRGCPFGCEFCLSSLDVPLRTVPLDRFLAAMQELLHRGALRFKFVDRTFNLNVDSACAVLRFFLERHRPGMFLHFEMIADRFPEGLRGLIGGFPAGALQLEIGVQTFNSEVATRIGRRQDNVRVEENLRFLREHTGVHIHADLIVGLPGETVESLGDGFDRLIALHPQEIQAGILKRLRGAPIARHDGTFETKYSPHAPYEIMQNRDIDFPTMQRLRRFARYWDLVGNSGNFIDTLPMIWTNESPFRSFLAFSDWIFTQVGRCHGIALTRLTELMYRYLTEEAGQPIEETSKMILRDYQRGGRSDTPAFLRVGSSVSKSDKPRDSSDLPRQGRFAAGSM
ncbi:MAG: DUF4080 domain-containing protein, partial [Phycisphaerales bacterium]